MSNFNRGGRSDFKYGNRRDSDRGGFSARGGSTFGGRGGRDSDRGGFRGNRGGGYGGRGEEREMFQAVCTECGKNCEVPFKPTGNKPVLCRDCFSARGGSTFGGRGGRGDDRGGRDSGRRDFGRNRDDHQVRDNTIGGKSAEHFDQQFSLLNEKLDKILQRLTPSYLREQAEPADEIAINEGKKVSKRKSTKKQGN